jgi:hypothetical protein
VPVPQPPWPSGSSVSQVASDLLSSDRPIPWSTFEGDAACAWVMEGWRLQLLEQRRPTGSDPRCTLEPGSAFDQSVEAQVCVHLPTAWIWAPCPAAMAHGGDPSTGPTRGGRPPGNRHPQWTSLLAAPADAVDRATISAETVTPLARPLVALG